MNTRQIRPLASAKWIVAGCCAIWTLVASPIASADVIYNVTWDGSLNTSYVYMFEGTSYQYLAGAGGFGGGMAFPSFTGSFASDKTFVVQFSAPVGQQIIVTKPTTADSLYLQLQLVTNDGGYSSPYGTADSLVFEGTTGTPPSGLNFGELSTANGVTDFWSSGQSQAVSDSFSFTKFTAQFTVPSALSTSFNNLNWYAGVVEFVATGGSMTSDPGAWVTLGVVPEPGSVSLLGLGALFFALRRFPSKAT
ncbi:MAG: PEP-CTERM sorting domain-containing protein [Verrucomicrobia bacterium]|nr:PEP-CTERM sorting domain-containing protein [Verrucomicrobiota bacterium]